MFELLVQIIVFVDDYHGERPNHRIEAVFNVDLNRLTYRWSSISNSETPASLR